MTLHINYRANQQQNNQTTSSSPISLFDVKPTRQAGRREDIKPLKPPAHSNQHLPYRTARELEHAYNLIHAIK